MTTNYIGPPPEWLAIEATLKEKLCWQLAFEAVILNYDTLLTDNVKTELIQQGLLDETGFTDAAFGVDYVDTLVRRNLFGTKTIEKAEEDAIAIESVLLGFSFNWMGNLATTRPYDALPPNQGVRAGQEFGESEWWYRFRYKGTQSVNWPPGARGALGLRDPAIIKWLDDTSAWADEEKNSGRGALTAEDKFNLLTSIYALSDPDQVAAVEYVRAVTIVDLISKVESNWPRSSIARMGDADLLQQQELFVYYYKLMAQILKKLIFGVGGTIDEPQPGGLVTTECIEQNIASIIADLVGELPEAIEETSEIAEGFVGGAILARPEELILKDSPKVRNLTPLDFQCFLLENISKLTAQRTAGSPFAPNYKNVIKVDSQGQPATVMNVIGHLGEDVVKEILDICPDVYGLLTPYIKVTRLDYDKRGAPINGSEQELEIPNFLAPEDVASITSGDLGRASGAGIKSFSWGLEGVQPAEVDNNITANLVMYFQSVKDFFGRSKQAGSRKANFLDLVIASPTVPPFGADPKTAKSKCSLDEELHRKYDGANFRIKVCAGWASPPNMQQIFPTMSKGKVEALEKAIKNTRVSLFLQQVRHLITFNENGSLEMSIDYQASLSGLLMGKTSDILAPSSEMHTRDIAKLEEEIDKLEARAEDQYKDEEDKEKIKEKLDEIVALRQQDRLIKYKKVLKKLFASDKIYNLTVNPAEFLLPPYADLTPKQKAARAKRRSGEGLLIKSGKGDTYALLSAVSDAAYSGATAEDAAEDYSEEETKRFDALGKAGSGDLTYVSYFYLGDLLDNILEQIKENNSKKGGGPGDLNFKFFISDVEMIDPLLALQVKNLEEAIACGNLRDAAFIDVLSTLDPTTFNTGIAQLMNIGDIPISVDAFQLWFKNNIVKKDRDKYFFLHFVKDICAYLITSALRSKCFGDSLNFEQRFDAQPLTLNKGNSSFGETTSVTELSKAHTTLTCGTQASDSVLGLILISTDSRPKGLYGHYGPDLRAGIYHHYLGSACGLVKKINFNREDQPVLREAKIQKKGALGPEQLRELYSAQLDLVGNNLYKNGNYIYISPLLLGATQEQLNLLGLHGYYLVTSVKSTITPNSFDTSITALHEGIKFGASKLLKPLVYEGLQAEEAPPIYIGTTDAETARAAGEAAGAAVSAAFGGGPRGWLAAKIVERRVETDIIESRAESRADVIAEAEYNLADGTDVVQTGGE